MIQVQLFDVYLEVEGANIFEIQRKLTDSFVSLVGDEFPDATLRYTMIVRPKDVARSDSGMAQIIRWSAEVEGHVDLNPDPRVPGGGEKISGESERSDDAEPA